VDADFALLERWRAGEDGAGQTLFRRHYAAIATFFRGKVGDRFEDLTQETFKTCVEVRERFRGHSTFRTFLFGIAWNQLRHFIRKKAHDEQFDFDASSISQIPALATPLTPWFEKSRKVQEVLEVLTHLPVKQHVLLQCYYTLELGYDELGEVFEQKPAAIRKQLERARDACREQHRRLFPAAPLDEHAVVRVLTALKPESSAEP
jgi:RNA polymerase sigma-70 factor (ECF subfamily)